MITPEQMAGYRAGWPERKENKQQELEIRCQKALSLTYKAAEFLKEKYQCRVILLGSLAEKGKFMEHSDIDLAIANLGGEHNFWQLYAKVMSILHPFDFDLIELEKVDPEVRDYIMQRGLEL